MFRKTFTRLLAWLSSFWRKQLVEQDRWDYYKPIDRYVYKYHDGEKEVTADPMVLYKKVMAKWPIIGKFLAEYKAVTDAETLARHDQLIAAIRELFGIKKLEEGGLSEQETLDLFNHFRIYANIISPEQPAPLPEPVKPAQEPAKPPEVPTPTPGPDPVPNGATETAKPMSADTLPKELPKQAEEKEKTVPPTAVPQA